MLRSKPAIHLMLFALCVLTSCEFTPPKNVATNEANPVDTILLPDADDFTAKSKLTPEQKITLSKVTVDDPAYYGENFLEELAKINFVPHYDLRDGFMLLGGKDTVFFPLPIEIEEEKNLVGKKDSFNYRLTIRQINYTTAIFKFQKLQLDSLLVDLSGEAAITPGFFLGDESDEDDETGVSYFANEYTYVTDDCQINIRVGSDDKQIRAKVNRYCEDKSKNITLAECPTLRMVK
ncbi:MAG: hypothetical protein AB8G15_01150 [Saprospiraceae bacterium]